MAPPETAIEDREVEYNGLNRVCADGDSNGDEMVPKVRKPYIITKQREKWTEEEHQKFLEALQLYGRAWRRIEEHIGTKTTLQIRSHAQKFFSKVMKESPNSGASIEIPPPRSKRKPMHPYPRKLGNQKYGYSTVKQLEKPLLQGSPETEEVTGSPTSVLSNVGSENSDQIVCKSSLETSGSGSDDPDSRSQSPTATSAGEHLCTDSEAPVMESDQDTQAPSIKLFGKMVVLSELKNSALSNESTKNLEAVESDMQRREQWPSAANPVVYYVPYAGDGVNVPTVMAPLPLWSVYGAWPFPIINPVSGNFEQQHEHEHEHEHEKESSSSGSATHLSEIVDETSDAGERQENVSVSSKQKKQEKYVRGFVPYKRHKTEFSAGDVLVGL